MIFRFACTAVAIATSATALAHHGFGRFDRTKPVEIEGVIKSIDFVNPHSYLNLDVIGPDGNPIAMRCEMRAATLLRRSGWSEEMFVAGAQAKIFGLGSSRRSRRRAISRTSRSAMRRSAIATISSSTRPPSTYRTGRGVGVRRAEHLGRLGAGAVRDRRAARAAVAGLVPKSLIAAVEVRPARDGATCRRRAGARGP